MPEPHIVAEFMKSGPRTMAASVSVRAGAEAMKEASVGTLAIESEGKLLGIVTDHDIVVQCLARGGDCDEMTLGSICSDDVRALSPRDSVDLAIQLMRDKSIRRMPVVDRGRAVGILALGDLAHVREPKSVLETIDAARWSG